MTYSDVATGIDHSPGAALEGTSFRTPDSLVFEQYWRSLPVDDGATLPTRQDFVPARIKYLLSRLVIAEFDRTSSTLLIRLAGTTLRERLNFDLTGRNYCDLLTPRIRTSVLSKLETIFDYPCGLWQHVPVQYEDASTSTIEVTCLPIHGNAGEQQVIVLLEHATHHLAYSHKGKMSKINTAETSSFINLGYGAPLD